jgi:N-acetyl-alpha-D-glucosaminyl L-malate synthase BshA
MKIGIMCHSGYGGSARIAIDSGLELSRRGHAVHLFTRTPPYLLPIKTNEISCYTLFTDKGRTEHPASLKIIWPDDELGRMVKLVISVTEKQGLDILHIHYALPFIFIAQSVKKELREKAPRIVLTLHGTDVIRLADGNIEPPISAARMLMYCDALTTVSASHAQLFARLSCRDSLPEIIPNFTDLSRFFPKTPSVTGSRPVLLHISNFRAIKNPCGVVEIFDRLREKIEAVLWLVGDGEEMEKVRALVGKKGLAKDVRFFGLLPDISNLVNGADLLVMSSIYESFCLTALEAMACGVPVLAPRVGGISEVVIHGKTGFLYPPGDYSIAAALAARLLSEQELYSQISMGAVRRAQNFDQKKIVGLYERLYCRVRSDSKAATG